MKIHPVFCSMDQINYLDGLFEPMSDYGKFVFLMFLIKKDDDLINDCGLLKNDVKRLYEEFKKVVNEQNDENLFNRRDEEESIFKRKSIYLMRNTLRLFSEKLDINDP